MSVYPERTEVLDINETPDGFVVYHPKTDRVHFLNHTAAAILELCNGQHSVDEIAEILAKGFGLEDIPMEEITSTLENFRKEELLLADNGEDI